jgi:hypothetical protein
MRPAVDGARRSPPTTYRYKLAGINLARMLALVR